MPVVPTHPLTTPDPDVLRWVVPDGLLPFTGGVAHAPALLQGLLDDGTLSAVQVEDGAVLTLLGDGRNWRREGARVRTALVDALGAPRSWRGVAGAHDVGPDEVLEAAARQIADGPVGAFARSHGGRWWCAACTTASSRWAWRGRATTARPPSSPCTPASSTSCAAAAPGWWRSAAPRSDGRDRFTPELAPMRARLHRTLRCYIVILWVERPGLGSGGDRRASR